MLYGKLSLTYSLFGAAFSVSGSFLGIYYVLALIKKRNKKSYIIYILAGAIMVSALLSLYKGITAF
jgi:ABC-type Fe3+-siderophore transport system permease subunit